MRKARSDGNEYEQILCPDAVPSAARDLFGQKCRDFSALAGLGMTGGSPECYAGLQVLFKKPDNRLVPEAE